MDVPVVLLGQRKLGPSYPDEGRPMLRSPLQPLLRIASDLPEWDAEVRAETYLLVFEAVSSEVGWAATKVLPSPFSQRHLKGCVCCRSPVAEELGRIAQSRLLGNGVKFTNVLLLVPAEQLDNYWQTLKEDVLVKARFRLEILAGNTTPESVYRY